MVGAPKLECGLLLMGPSGCGAVEVGVPIPMAPFGRAPVLPSQIFWSQSAVFPSVWHLASFSHAYLAVKCLWNEYFLNIPRLLPVTEINTANTVAVPHLKPFNSSAKEMTEIVPCALENNQCCPRPFACTGGEPTAG